MPTYEFYKNIVFFSLKNRKKRTLEVEDEEVLDYGNFKIYLKNKPNKKYIVTNYKKIYKFLYKFRKIITLFGYPEMPKLNKAPNFLYANIILKNKNLNKEKNKIQLKKAIKFIQTRGYKCDFFMIGSYENTFLEKNLSEMRTFKYKSKLYQVFYEITENNKQNDENTQNYNKNFKNDNLEFLFWNL